MTAADLTYDDIALLHRCRILYHMDLTWENRENALASFSERMRELMSQLDQEEWLKTMARMLREFDNPTRSRAERKHVPFSTVHSPEWWAAFEARVDATAEPSRHPFEVLLEETPSSLTDYQRPPLRSNEDMTPVKVSVFIASSVQKGDGKRGRYERGPGEWKNYKFDPRDLNELHFCELPNLLAVEGPRGFKDVVMQAKRKLEWEKGNSVPTLHLFPLTAIQDLIDGTSR